MSNSAKRAAYEQKLSVAARSLYWAAERAEEMGDTGAAEDCMQLRGELSRLLEDSVSGRRRPRRQQQIPLA